MEKAQSNAKTKPSVKKSLAKRPAFQNPEIEESLLNKLKQSFSKKIFTLKEARKYKVSPQLLSYYVKKDHLKRLSQGVYAFEDSLSFDFHSVLREKLICVPQAIVGLETALKLYGLTDEIPDKFHLIVPLSNVPKRKLKDVQFYQMKNSLYKKHTKIIEGFPVSSFERTIIDLFRFGYSTAFVLSVIKESRRKKISFNLGKIKKMSIPYRVKGKVSQLLEVL